MWIFCFVIMLGLFVTNVKAQEALIVGRDSSYKDVNQITRAQFLAKTYPQQIEFLTHSVPFKIIDLENAMARDFLIPLPGVTFVSASDFYGAPVQKQELILTDPADWKVYN
jgi:hypothetical protein